MTDKKLYRFGIVVTILGLAGIAEAITGHGSIIISGAVFAVGFGICLDVFLG